MKLTTFFKLVELQTKVASVIPFLIGVAFSLYRYETFVPVLLGLFFMCMICVDMATTAINNYMDYKRAYKREGYNYESHNAIVKDGLSEKQVITVIVSLLTIGGIFGISLAIRTDLVVLLIGLAASFVGIIYSFGPIPISRTPLGEIFSGILMGGAIFFITVYLAIYEQGIIYFALSGPVLLVEVNLLELIIIAVAAMPLVLMIANIMLANNICDIEDDVINRRYTLPYYIGRQYAIYLFEALYGMAYCFILIAIIMSWLPVTCLLVGFTAIPVAKGMKIFRVKQTKAETFVLAVQNFVLIAGSYLVTLVMSLGITYMMG